LESSSSPKIDISIFQNDNTSATVKIKDNGCGISFCFDCNKNRCINCDQFQIGKTTKAEGTGTGMIYVQSTLKEMDSKLFIKSKPEEGTEIEIHFKNLASAEMDEISNLYLKKKDDISSQQA